jgi:hypothetical protein
VLPVALSGQVDSKFQLLKSISEEPRFIIKITPQEWIEKNSGRAVWPSVK